MFYKFRYITLDGNFIACIGSYESTILNQVIFSLEMILQQPNCSLLLSDLILPIQSVLLV